MKVWFTWYCEEIFVELLIIGLDVNHNIVVMDKQGRPFDHEIIEENCISKDFSRCGIKSIPDEILYKLVNIDLQVSFTDSKPGWNVAYSKLCSVHAVL